MNSERTFNKQKYGFYINHDLLMSLKPAKRSRMITYFIAMNNPEKLNQLDREKIKETFFKNYRSNYFIGLTSLALIMPLRKNVSTFFLLPLLYFVRKATNHTIWEKSLIESDIMGNMALKYKFSLFDFHNSKKEAEMRYIIQEIKEEPFNNLNWTVDSFKN